MEILKKFEGRLAGDAQLDQEAIEIFKLGGKGRLMSKTIYLEGAENGFVVSVNLDVEFGEGDKKNFRYMTKRFIYTDVKDAMAQLQKEMDFKIGDEITLDNLNQKKAKVHVNKKQIRFVVGDGAGHIHQAVGNIISKKEGDKFVKYFEGQTEDNATFWKLTQDKKVSSDFTRAVDATLGAHSHKFAVKLSNMMDDKVYGSTDLFGEHSHPIDILNLRSSSFSNTPDK